MTKRVLARFGGVVLLVLIAAAVGFAFNALRSDGVPWIYQPLPTAEAYSNTATTEPGWITLAEIQAAAPDSLLMVDARSPLFFKRSHVPGAINIPKQYLARDLPLAVPILEKYEDKRVVVYCAAEDCEDSLLVSRELIKLGMRQVDIFKGGWKAWRAANLPEERG